MDTTIIQFDDATIGYPETHVLEHFSWRIQRGQRWAITGANGSGKTTLVRTLLGLIPLQGGRLVRYNERGEEVAKISASYLPQINQIDRHFPIHVEEVIDSGLPSELRRSAERRTEVERLAEATDLTPLLHQPIGRLSGGQLQRTLLARALASRPELLILDEPLSFLDKGYKTRFEGYLTDLVDPATTILMVTHDLAGDEEGWRILSIGQD